ETRQIVSLNLDDRKVRQLIRADHLRIHHPAVMQCDLHVNRAIHHMIVRNDVTVRRDDDPGTDAALQRLLLLALEAAELPLPLLPLAIAITEAAKRPIRPEELRKARR